MTEQEVEAYYMGRGSVDYGTRCTFTEPNLIEAWKRGRRHVQAEDALDRDTEWDSDN